MEKDTPRPYDIEYHGDIPFFLLPPWEFIEKRVEDVIKHLVPPSLAVRYALWSGTDKNRDVSTGPLACPFARLIAPLIRSLAPDCSLRSRPPLRSLVRSIAHFAHSLAHGKVNF